MAAAIVFAIVSALSNACSAVLQRLAAANRTPAARPAWRTAIDLVRQPVWLLGAFFLAGTFGFQALALYFGPLSVVQPVLVLELIFTLGLRVFLLHDDIAPRTWSAALTICLGLAAFLIIASPAPGTHVPDAGQWILAVGTRAPAVAALLLLGRYGSPVRRAALLGAATAVVWSVDAAFVKQTVDVLAHSGPLGLLTQLAALRHDRDGRPGHGPAAGRVRGRAAGRFPGHPAHRRPPRQHRRWASSCSTTSWAPVPGTCSAPSVSLAVLAAGVVHAVDLGSPRDDRRGTRPSAPGSVARRSSPVPALSFDGMLVVALVAVAVPVLLGLAPRLPVPGAVLEVLAGILIGPSVLGWVHLDAPIEVLSDLGLGMLLFLAGLEIDVGGLRGPLGRLAGQAFGGSVLVGLACGYILSLAGVRAKPVFLAVVLISTSAGLLLPLLKDAGLHRAPFGQLVMAAAALAELVPVVMLSLLFSATSGTSGPARVPWRRCSPCWRPSAWPSGGCGTWPRWTGCSIGWRTAAPSCGSAPP